MPKLQLNNYNPEHQEEKLISIRKYKMKTIQQSLVSLHLCVPAE